MNETSACVLSANVMNVEPSHLLRKSFQTLIIASETHPYYMHGLESSWLFPPYLSTTYVISNQIHVEYNSRIQRSTFTGCVQRGRSCRSRAPTRPTSLSTRQGLGPWRREEARREGGAQTRLEEAHDWHRHTRDWAGRGLPRAASRPLGVPLRMLSALYR